MENHFHTLEEERKVFFKGKSNVFISRINEADKSDSLLNALKIIEWRCGKVRRIVERNGKGEGLGEEEKRRRGGRGKRNAKVCVSFPQGHSLLCMHTSTPA